MSEDTDISQRFATEAFCLGCVDINRTLVFIELECFLNSRYGSDQTMQSYTRKFSEYMDLHGIIKSDDHMFKQLKQKYQNAVLARCCVAGLGSSHPNLYLPEHELSAIVHPGAVDEPLSKCYSFATVFCAGMRCWKVQCIALVEPKMRW